MTAAALSTPEPLWTAQDAAEATGGHVTRDWAATGVAIDSRHIEPGDLFVALRGESTDGHRFIADALAKGAAAVVADHFPDNAGSGVPALMVADTQTALEDLARAARARSQARVIAVTGSVGKTGTKNALAHVLGAQGETHAAAASHNNHWGVPLTLARLPRSAAYCVVEMGMNAPGEIAALSRLARPHVTVITEVAAAHTAAFASVEGIADAKAEIFQGADPGATAVLPRDNPHVARLAEHAGAAGIERLISFGRDAEATIRVVEEAPDERGTEVTAALGLRHLSFRVGIPGDHWVMNALAVLGAVAAVDADPGAAAASLAELEPAPGRGQRHTVAVDGGTATLIDESYNANPTSMRAAIALLARAEPGPGGRRIAVLGDMLELGERSAHDHGGLAEPLRAAGVDAVFTCGDQMTALRDALPAAVHAGHAADAETLTGQVTAALRPGDVVLVKGSAGARTGAVVRALTDAG
ncbi:UDP-N-acetylmuramoyl-tripeptide--D-alanyl-D-alanine ligase [Limimonas halophila]|uniref:UDP-N-acetylmuramoyl-tripeptide--D-alanyl-D-alanine ligase n=1 Tax=Limimonas halophila TaxID=1082479 RepID=A0A1G7U6G8_9PROT|nr:UDP-N-acetylmuramoylalanyl-D-glutamyl-2,6-diaminopimelate--D-alanyl-D-alanine ligase [Limimonas halophila]SDG42861.1 UDP-N-acetylmuramoyl-tripeptide--D-alanyl-D-alanine ligase [Limimonas halophila]